jgi:hypothetical protein
MALSTLVDSVSENLRSKFPENGTLGELRAASTAAVDAALSEFDSPVEFFLRYPETLEDRPFVEECEDAGLLSVGERLDQLAALSIRKRLLPVEREPELLARHAAHRGSSRARM